MKRKILFLLLSILTLLTFTSCGEKNAYKLVNDAIDKTLNLPSFELEWDRTLKMESDTISDENGNIIKIKVQNYNSENQKMYIENYSKNLDSTTLIYQEGNYYYESSDKGNFKYDKNNSQESAEVLAYETICSLGNFLVDYPKEYLEDAVITVIENDHTSVLFEVPIDFLFGELLFETQENATVDVSINTDGYISSFKVYYTVDTQYYSLIQTEVEILSFKNPGESVEVEPLEGYETFEEITVE